MSENVAIEPATEADLDELSEMLGGLFAQESDFRPDKEKQLRGLRLIFEQPSRGRVFVLRRDGAIVGMINLLFTKSSKATATARNCCNTPLISPNRKIFSASLCSPIARKMWRRNFSAVTAFASRP
jgi:hypothetical protein